MTRLDFITRLWKKIIIPFLWSLLIVFAARILFNVMTNPGPERMATLILFVLLILIAVTSLIRAIGTRLTDRIIQRIQPDRLKRLQRVEKVLSVLLLALSAWQIFNSWAKDWPVIILIIGLLLIERLLNRRVLS